MGVIRGLALPISLVYPSKAYIRLQISLEIPYGYRSLPACLQASKSRCHVLCGKPIPKGTTTSKYIQLLIK